VAGAICYVAIVLILLAVISATDVDIGWAVVLLGALIISSFVMAIVTPALRKDWLETSRTAGVEIVLLAIVGWAVGSSYIRGKSRLDWLFILVR
jgi:hypothetical protein